jgi:hypothetical protein
VRTSWNIAVQAGALGLAVLLRLVAPGWLLIVLVVSVVGLLLPAAPLITAVLTRRRGRLGWAVQSPFLALAALMVIAAGWTADFDDQRDYVPAVELFGPGADLGLGRGELARIGEFAVLGYLGCLVWLLLALMATTRVRTIPMTG